MSLFSDIVLGARVELGAHRFTAAEIVAFATRYDPQLFHLDADVAKASLLGGLCASGWHTASIFMRLNAEALNRAVERERLAGRPVPDLGPSPGFRDMRWPRPVYAGDDIRYFQTVTAKRPSASRPGWGLIETDNLGLNQKGETVFAFIGTAFLGLA
ncbi:acyl dehydratase [Aureimonas endophytica]|uniref:Acyl dehydratase n=1 Tax=Aureimonas endophytica TaxID=2027858 RepID=A0A916ZYG7_9HYPH|nr:MaoC family dehydratase [Aureimonas endophytica]GGE19201.1 acyl dehydratase [Aureimonas endophytica]